MDFGILSSLGTNLLGMDTIVSTFLCLSQGLTLQPRLSSHSQQSSLSLRVRLMVFLELGHSGSLTCVACVLTKCWSLVGAGESHGC